MKAIILSAGEGKRLRPLTNDIPKGMVTLFDKSLLERQIEIFRQCGIDDITIVTGYCHDKIIFPNIRYFRNEKYETTNMVETLFCAKKVLDGSVIVSYGDIMFEKKILQQLINEKNDLSVVIDKEWLKYWKIRFQNPLDDAESLIIDENNYIKNIGQKVNNLNEIMGQYIGLMKFQNLGLDLLKEFYEKAKNESLKGNNPLNSKFTFEKSYITDLLQALIIEGCEIKAIPIHGGWLELDTINDYEIYNQLHTKNKLQNFISLDS